MLNFLVKKTLKKIVMKLATDEVFRNKAKVVIKNTKELNSEGQLMRSLGKSFGRMKSKIKEDF
tara:strand:- start:253 stop:441 length:189 start_codon:yes stop_codon:yes gene_type:complete